jgi:hypothetical protein
MCTIALIPGRGYVHTRSIPIIPFDVSDEAQRDLVELLFAAVPGRSDQGVCIVCSSAMSSRLFRDSQVSAPSPEQICLAVLKCAGEYSHTIRHIDSCKLSTHLVFECIRLRLKSLLGDVKACQYSEQSYALHVEKFMLGGPALMVAGKAVPHTPTAEELAAFEEMYAQARDEKDPARRAGRKLAVVALTLGSCMIQPAAECIDEASEAFAAEYQGSHERMCATGATTAMAFTPANLHKFLPRTHRQAGGLHDV